MRSGDRSDVASVAASPNGSGPVPAVATLNVLRPRVRDKVATLRGSERRLRVLIAPDAFKGSLDAMAAAQAIAAGWRRQRPDDQLDLCPMADGGDGFGPVLAQWLGAEPRNCDTVDAAGRPRRARWWWAPAPRLPMPVAHLPVAAASAPASIAIVESAEAIGLAWLPPALRHPLPLDGAAPRPVHPSPPAQGDPDSGGLDSSGLNSNGLESRGLDSRGLAPLLLAAAAAGVERLLLGLGGSATNDGGFGLARALGWRFFDADGAAIQRWGDLERLERVEPPPQPPLLPQLVIAVDVRNPLLGPEGATAIYGPQKGLTAQQLPRAEACLRRLAHGLESRFPGVAERPGSGAAGGLGYGLQVFCGGQLRAGAELVAELCGLEARVEAADLVIGGEGRFDRQSLMGKGTGRLLRRVQRTGRCSLLLVGQLEEEALDRARAEAALQGCAVAARALVPDLTDLTQACAAPALWLERLAEQAAADLDALSPAAAP
jgi:glycerate kinase